MKVFYDETLIEVTPRYVEALVELSRVEAEMMADLRGDPSYWRSGLVILMDLMTYHGTRFYHGGLGVVAPVGVDFRVESLYEMIEKLKALGMEEAEASKFANDDPLRCVRYLDERAVAIQPEQITIVSG